MHNPVGVLTLPSHVTLVNDQSITTEKDINKNKRKWQLEVHWNAMCVRHMHMGHYICSDCWVFPTDTTCAPRSVNQALYSVHLQVTCTSHQGSFSIATNQHPHHSS